MSDILTDRVHDFYDGRHMFFTGSTGMLGTVHLSRLVLDTSISCVYALARGGETRLWKLWRKNLPSDIFEAVQNSNKLVILDGDITKPNCGLADDKVQLIRDNVSLFIHAASTINLSKSLGEVADEIIRPTIALSRLALECPKLTQFVYVSTAYSGAFLRETANGDVLGSDAVIKEDITPIRSGSSVSAAQELADLAEYGNTPEYTFVRHPFPYSYAKHLAERLLKEQFHEAQADEKLLIFRPSCIGPTESKPAPFFEVPGSCPVTTCVTAAILNPPSTLKFPSHLPAPSQSSIDEIPADIVANRLIVHMAFGSSGCVHAVSGIKNSHLTEDIFDSACKMRRSWWIRPKMKWVNEHWKSDKVWPIAKLFTIFGTSFAFDQYKTEGVWDKMSDLEQSRWPLFPSQHASSLEAFSGRREVILGMMKHALKKRYHLPASLAKYLIVSPSKVVRQQKFASSDSTIVVNDVVSTKA